jgi:hypothetical protein
LLGKSGKTRRKKNAHGKETIKKSRLLHHSNIPQV